MQRVIEHYGADPAQVGEWFLPDHTGAPLVILVHGGFWRPVWRRDLEEPSAQDLAAHGFAVFNVDYRTYEHPWPTTLADTAAAIDHAFAAARRHGVDTTRRVICGHSAGGGLVAWATSRAALAEHLPGADTAAPTFDAVILHAPVASWAQASHEHLGDGAVDTFMGGRPEDVPQRYADSDPIGLVPDPAGRRLILHGDADTDVPLSQSLAYTHHLHSHDVVVEHVTRPGEGHYEILDPDSPVSQLRRDFLTEVLLAPRQRHADDR